MRIIAAFVLLLAAGEAAFAADMEPTPGPAPVPPATYAPAPPPPFTWTGFYVGANGGYGWANSSGTVSAVGGPFNGLSVATSGNVSGPLGGGQVGFNWQTGALVLGVEGDFDWSGQNTTLALGCGIGCTVNEKAGVNWFGTARARVGYAFDRLLIYATGGGAWLNVTDNLTATGGGATINLVSLSASPFGFAGGAGAEYAITNNISARVEYLYLQSLRTTASAPVALIGGTISETATIKDSVVRAGVNFKFTGF